MDPLDALRQESARYGYGVRLGCGLAGEPTFAPPERGLLVIGPPRCGKTTSVVVPNLLSACGPVITTSTKPDLLLTTAAARSRVGECLLFDPSGRTPEQPGVRRVAWSPLLGAEDWDTAALTAQAMVLAARPGSDRAESLHWTERAQALLGPAFHAAALHGMKMADLLSVVDRREGTTLTAILARRDTEMPSPTKIPLDTLEGVLSTDAREQSGIWSTASSMLSAYRSERALAGTEGDVIDFDSFVRGGGTLYVCSGSDEQLHAAPIVSGLLRGARVAGYRAAASGALGYASGRPPLLLLLDEVANIAPIHDLPALVSEGGSQGVVTVACLQDLSQAVARWGRLGEGFLSLFNVKIVFPGIGDTRTLEAVSMLAGDHDVRTVSVSDGPRLSGLPGLLGRHAPGRRTESTRRERRLPVDLIARGESGHVVCLDGAVPSFVEARPWFDVGLVRAAVEGRGVSPELSRDAVGERTLGRGL